MESGALCVFLLCVMVLSAASMTVNEEVGREKRGVWSGGAKGALLGGAAGWLIPGMSVRHGALLGGGLGAGIGGYKHYQKHGKIF